MPYGDHCGRHVRGFETEVSCLEFVGDKDRAGCWFGLRSLGEALIKGAER